MTEEQIARAVERLRGLVVPSSPSPDTLRQVFEFAGADFEAGARLIVRAVIEATREPTAAMLNAARDWSAARYGKPIGSDDAVGCWQAMHDALARDG